ncbi:MAG TPA: tRNA preQ1(34) S-adenosylmethionine ribosyltransferase-isomerase QueA [Mariprofundaceae bacterium]|nr:tRNA preQ1(34) S-adenosylmethionine ribosyltransferase-isomerase QueA [Mariprofundaceae bacterium]
MKVSDFDFDLPEVQIASRPLPERDASRLLVLEGKLEDRGIRDLPSLVQPGDVWVINDTRVIPARLLGKKTSGGQVEVLLLEPAGEANIWHAWGKANKPLQPGACIIFADGFTGEVLKRDGKNVLVHLHVESPFPDVAGAIKACGHMPLPPYIDRPDSDEDRARYQTVFAEHDGAVAAPTAGLHLTAELMAAMQEVGAKFAHVTLHVGPGTFQPVQVENLADHPMHEEAYIVPEETAHLVNQAKSAGNRIVAVGTTSLRTLEAASSRGQLQAGAGRTSIFIYPGYDFQLVDALLTNFHLPRSTLIMLVSALAGRERVLAAYKYAREHGYRFYSYGDAMFIPGRVR